MATGTADENRDAHPMEEDHGRDILSTEQDVTVGTESTAPASAEDPEPSIPPHVDVEMDSTPESIAQPPDKNSQVKRSTNVEMWHHPILDYLAEVDAKMGRFREYIREQKDSGKPLYQWELYTDYYTISRAVSELDEAVAACKQFRISRERFAAELARARGYSTSVSRSAAYALRVMSEKTEKYTEEISGLSTEDKTDAHTHIIEEVKKVLKHSTLATRSTWAAADLLQVILVKSSTKKPIPQKSWAWSLAMTVLTAGISAAVGILAANLHLFSLATYNLAPKGAHGHGVYKQVLDLVQRTQDVTNLTSEIYTVKLQDLGQRYEDLAALAESHGLRIDNLVDALGPTNEEGNYYLSKPKVDDLPSEGNGDRLDKISDDAQRQIQRLHDEMELMRKNMNRLDLRLTRRLDRIQGS